jgi:SAM-dependent methyltransferase
LGLPILLGCTMVARVSRVLRNFLTSSRKREWLADKLSWKLFELRQRRQDVVNRRFDRVHGTDTAGSVLLAAAGVSELDAQRGNLVYRPLWESSFHATMRRLRRSLGAELARYTFIDIGSGKGKLLLLATRYPFKRIIGVEYAPALHAIAMSNVAQFTRSGNATGNISPVQGDATTFALPPGPIVAMLFNALDRATTARLVVSLVAQRTESNDPIFLIYENARRAKEIGTALAVPHPWETLEVSRHRIIVGNLAAALAWRSEGTPRRSQPGRPVSNSQTARGKA